MSDAIVNEFVEKRGRKKKYATEEEFIEHRREACRILSLIHISEPTRPY